MPHYCYFFLPPFFCFLRLEKGARREAAAAADNVTEVSAAVSMHRVTQMQKLSITDPYSVTSTFSTG